MSEIKDGLRSVTPEIEDGLRSVTPAGLTRALVAASRRIAAETPAVAAIDAAEQPDLPSQADIDALLAEMQQVAGELQRLARTTD